MRHFFSAFLPVLLVLTACSVKQPKPPRELSQKERKQIRGVYVIASNTPAKIESAFFASGKGAAAVKGVGKGFGDTATGMASGGGAGSGGGVVILFILVAPFMMTGESIYYAVDTPSAEEQKKIARDVNVTVESLRLQKLLADEITASGNRLTKMKFECFDETNSTIPSAGAADKSIALLHVKTDVLSYDDDKEAIRISTQDRLSIPGEDNVSVERKVDTFFAIKDIKPYLEDNASRLKKEIMAAFRQLADETVSSIFLRPSYKVKLDHNGYAPDDLAPISPKLQHCFFCFGGIGAGKADSLNPQMVWGPFPSASLEKYVEPRHFDDISDVVYDLKIWSEGSKKTDYEYYGLRDPKHRVEKTLQCGHEYQWSVRARYVKEGVAYASRWNDGYAFETPECKDVIDHREETKKKILR